MLSRAIVFGRHVEWLSLTIQSCPEESEHADPSAVRERSHGLWMWPLFKEQVTQGATSQNYSVITDEKTLT